MMCCIICLKSEENLYYKWFKIEMSLIFCVKYEINVEIWKRRVLYWFLKKNVKFLFVVDYGMMYSLCWVW